MQKVLIYVFALGVVSYLGWQVYILQSERMELREEFVEVDQEFNRLQEDNVNLQEELDYLSDPYNLEKELRSRFNYKLPNEELIIIVPEEEDATSTSE